MIEIENLTKEYKTRSGKRRVLDNISLQIKPGEKVGILGRNGSGKSTLIKLIGGSEAPTSGVIKRNMTVSWSVGINGGLQNTLTGMDNLKFICRIYNKSYDDKISFVKEVTELGKYLFEPVANYSSGMKAKLGLAISMVLDFDCYLVDESLSVGDKNFQEKYKSQLENKRKDKSMILVSHLENHIKQHCSTIYVLHNGKLKYFPDASAAYEYYNILKNDSSMELSK